MDIISYILSKKYTDQTVDGMGALKGAPCTVQSIVDITDGKRVTLAWESNSGVEQTQSFDIMNGEDGANTIEWNQIQQSGTKIAEIVINGSTTNVYAPNGGGGAGGGHTIIDPAGNDMDQEDGLQFTGNVAVSDDSENGKTVINIPQEVVSLTQAQYNALPSSKLTDGKIYCISDSVSGVDGYPPLIYSLEEREVGVWTDGKPLYQKTIISDVSQSTGAVIIATGISNVEEIIQTFGSSSYGSNDNWIFLPFDDDSNQTNISNSIIKVRKFNRNNGNLTLYIGSDYNGQYAINKIRITLQYTKTTDTAGSGIWNDQGGYAHHYSTSEKVIGTWIDGKTLYEITFDFEIPTNTTTVPHGISNLKKVVSIDAVAYKSDLSEYAQLPFAAMSGGTSWNAAFEVDQTNINLELGSSYKGYYTWMIATIRYTKTTD